MRLQAIITILALVFASTASVLNVNIFTDKSGVAETDTNHDQKALMLPTDNKASWRRRDSNNLVPLHPGAKTGALPVEVEEGLTSASVSSANGSGITASCNPFKCGGTVIKAAPCIAAAVKCGCVEPLKTCSVSVSDLCSCISCLPSPIPDLMNKLGVCSSSFLRRLPARPEADDDEDADYPEFVAFSQRSASFLAYRGDITKNTLAEAKELATAGFCPGTQCSDCGSGCCIGICAPIINKCIGQCL